MWREVTLHRYPLVQKQKVTVFDVSDFREPVNAASHLLTGLWAAFATIIMVRLAGPGRRLPFAIYGGSMILLFTASGLFHAIRFTSDWQQWFFQRLDHSSIYLLIAGTNTPGMAVLLRGVFRRWCLCLIWGLALLGFSTMWIFPKPPHALNIGFFLGMGWLGICPVVQYYRAVRWRAMNWVWFGALFYTVGAVCELTKWPTVIEGRLQAHEVMHVFHSAASVCFFMFGMGYVLPYRRDPEPAPEAPGRGIIKR